MSIGERITELRKSRNLSQAQLAKILNVSRQAVSKWENDINAPDTIKLIHLADVLDTDVEYLATGNHLSAPVPIKIDFPDEKSKNTVEKIVEKPVVVEKIVEKPIEKIIEKTVIRKVYRTKYIRSTLEYVIIFCAGLFLGILIGLFL